MHLKRSPDEDVVPVDGFFIAKVVIVDESDFPSLNLAQARPSQLSKVRIVHVERELRRVLNA